MYTRERISSKKKNNSHSCHKESLLAYYYPNYPRIKRTVVTKQVPSIRLILLKPTEVVNLHIFTRFFTIENLGKD